MTARRKKVKDEDKYSAVNLDFSLNPLGVR